MDVTFDIYLHLDWSMAIDNVQDQCVTGSPQTAVLSLPFPVVTTSRPGSVPVRCQVAHTRNYAHYPSTPARVIPWRASQNLINKLISGNARAIIRTIVHRYTGMLVTIFYKKKKVDIQIKIPWIVGDPRHLHVRSDQYFTRDTKIARRVSREHSLLQHRDMDTNLFAGVSLSLVSIL